MNRLTFHFLILVVLCSCAHKASESGASTVALCDGVVGNGVFKKLLIALIAMMMVCGAYAERWKLAGDLRNRINLERCSSCNIDSKMKTGSQTVRYNVFVFLNDRDRVFSAAEVAELGGELDATLGDMQMMLLTAAGINKIADDCRVRAIDGASRVRKKMVTGQTAKQLSTVHSVATASAAGLTAGYTGKDVVVAVVDGGFSTVHPAFKDRDGKLRIKRLYFPKDGVDLYSPEAIEAQGTDDIYGDHGAHTSGIAAGSEMLITDSNGKQISWSGVAPESDIVLAKYSSQQTATGDAWDAYDYGVILSSIKAFNYADSVGKPCVANYSIGHNMGRHTINSAFAKGMKELVDNKPGHLATVSSSNEGDHLNSLDYTFASNEDVLGVCLKADDADSDNEFQVWTLGPENDAIKAKFIYAWSMDGEHITISELKFKDGVANVGGTQIALSFGYDAVETDRIRLDITVRYTEMPETHVLLLRLQGGEGLRVIGLAENEAELSATAGIQLLSSFYDPEKTAKYLSADFSVNDMVCNPYVFSVGAYNYQPVNSNGDMEAYPNIFGNAFKPFVPTNTICDFSSYGTDFNKEPGKHPFVIYPGDHVISTLNPMYAKYYPDVDFSWVDDVDISMFPISEFDPESPISCYITHAINGTSQNCEFVAPLGMMSGTSMASPYFAGTVALCLQANPQLTNRQLREIIESLPDEVTLAKPYDDYNIWDGYHVPSTVALLKAVEATAVKTGDVNGDGVVDVADISTAAAIILGLKR